MIYLDANVIIRLLEGAPTVRTGVANRLRREAAFCTSQMSRLECRSKPIQDQNLLLLAEYDAFFAAAEMLVLEIDAAVIDAATHIRAAHKLRSPDALHLATATLCGASVFLTGDQKLPRFTGLPVEVI